MHELGHTTSSFDTKLGGFETENINRVNIMRAELNGKGFNYGQRQSHRGTSLGSFGSKTGIIPFSQGTADELHNNGYINKPKSSNSKYMLFSK